MLKISILKKKVLKDIKRFTKIVYIPNILCTFASAFQKCGVLCQFDFCQSVRVHMFCRAFQSLLYNGFSVYRTSKTNGKYITHKRMTQRQKGANRTLFYRQHKGTVKRNFAHGNRIMHYIKKRFNIVIKTLCNRLMLAK